MAPRDQFRDAVEGAGVMEGGMGKLCRYVEYWPEERRMFGEVLAPGWYRSDVEIILVGGEAVSLHHDPRGPFATCDEAERWMPG